MNKFLILIGTALLFLACDSETKIVNNDLKKANLTFSNLKVDGKTISPEQLLKQIKGKEKEGFKIKSITISDETIAELQGNPPNLKLNIKKAGTFKIILILTRNGFEDVVVNGQITIKEVTAIFEKFTRTDGNPIITTPQILGQIRGLTGLNYKLKSISITDTNKAEVEGDKPNFSIKIKKAGTFTATIVLEKNGNLDVEIKDCQFIIRKPAPPRPTDFNFLELKKTDGNAIITTDEILGRIRGLTGLNYKLKSINITDTNKAEVEGDEPNFSIKIKKTGTFTATIILEKSGQDVTLNNCQFDISSPALTFSKLTRTDSNKTITTAQILAQIQGNRGGYTIKNISITDTNKAEKQGDKPNLKIKIKQAGTFTATIILEKNGFLDIPLNNCEFIIRKPAPPFTFSKLTRTDGNKTITTAQILKQIQSTTTAKNGWTIKYIRIPILHGSKAEVPPGTKNIKVKQAGAAQLFTANITLEKSGFFDVELKDCEFIISSPRPYFFKYYKKRRYRNNYNRRNFSTNTREQRRIYH